MSDHLLADLTVADLEAMGDVLDQIGEASDSMTVEQAVAFREAIGALIKKARLALDLCEMQLVGTLESPRQFGNVLYEVGNKGKWRPNHGTIKGTVKRHSVANEDGEMRDAVDAVDAAIELMYALFVAPSTFPKQGALDRLGLDKPDVGAWKDEGKKVKVTEVPDEVVAQDA